MAYKDPKLCNHSAVIICSQSNITSQERNKMDAYTEHGYASRRDYLDSLAEDYDIDRDTVYMMADVLGPTEDFDGLVSSLEDLDY